MKQQASTLYVFIADDEGMQQAFPQIRQRLAEECDDHVALIYRSEDARFVFRRELEVLSQRFPVRFLVQFEAASGSLADPQETLEAMINSNTKAQILFLIAASEELRDTLTERLQFLGIGKNKLQLIF